MKVKDFYVGLGNSRDWECRRKIERAVMQNHKVKWGDEITDDVAGHIANADREYSKQEAK